MNRSTYKPRGSQNLGWTDVAHHNELRNNYRAMGRPVGLVTEKTILHLRNCDKKPNNVVEAKAHHPGKIMLQLRNKQPAKVFSFASPLDTGKVALAQKESASKVLPAQRQRQTGQGFPPEKEELGFKWMMGSRYEDVYQMTNEAAMAIKPEPRLGSSDKTEYHLPLYERRGRKLDPLLQLTQTREPNPYALLDSPHSPIIKCSFNIGACGSPWSIAKDVAEFALRTPDTPSRYMQAGPSFFNQQPLHNFL